MQYALYVRTACFPATTPTDTSVQLARLRELARERRLPIRVELFEYGGATTPGSRPGFSRLLNLLQQGVVDAILVERLERLSRNNTETALLARMLEEGTIREIVTPQRTFRAGEAVPFFDLAFLPKLRPIPYPCA